MEKRTEQDDIEILLEILPKGKENAIHLSELSEKMQMSKTKVKRLIHEARKIFSIISGGKGYYLAETEEEKQKFVKMMSKHAISRFESIRVTKHELKKDPAQMVLEGVE